MGLNSRGVAQHGSLPRLADGSFPLTRGSVTGRTVLDRRTIHVADITTELESEYPDVKLIQLIVGHRTIVGTPLLREGEALGAIVLRRTEVRPFTDRQIELLRSFADQAVIAIENTRLFEEVQARTRELQEALEYQTSTSEVLGVISRSPTDVQPAFDSIAASAAQLCGGIFSNLQIYDGELLHLVGTHNIGPNVFDKFPSMYPRRPDRTQVSGRAILDRVPVHVTDVLEDPEYQRDVALAGGWRAMLSVPMLIATSPPWARLAVRSAPHSISRWSLGPLSSVP
jgi:two-component system, NtrC family, sensor kinase